MEGFDVLAGESGERLYLHVLDIVKGIIQSFFLDINMEVFRLGLFEILKISGNVDIPPYTDLLLNILEVVGLLSHSFRENRFDVVIIFHSFSVKIYFI